MRIAKATPLLLIALVACSSGDTQNKAADAAVDTLVADVTIAGPGGADADGFGSVSGLASRANGDVLVADGLNHVVHIFAQDGAHRFTIGRQGSGPGEFNRPCCLAVDARDRLWVRDGDMAYDVFQLEDDSAYFLRRVRMAHNDLNRHAPVTFDGAGNIIDIGMKPDSATGERGLYRLHLDSASRVTRKVRLHGPPEDSTAIRKVTRQIPGKVATYYSYQPHGPAELVAHSPKQGFAHALSSRYAIDWRDGQGNLVRHITQGIVEGPSLSAGEKANADSSLAQNAKHLGIRVSELGFEVPPRKQPLRSLFFDRDGRLWVELSVADGAPRTAHVYSTDGTLERTVQWPASIRLTDGEIRNGTAWGIARDELGVETVVRLRL